MIIIAAAADEVGAGGIALNSKLCTCRGSLHIHHAYVAFLSWRNAVRLDSVIGTRCKKNYKARMKFRTV